MHSDESPLARWEDQNARLKVSLDVLAMLADHLLTNRRVVNISIRGNNKKWGSS